MASVDDVAAYILQRLGQISTWKLQKLLYYAQAWHVVWDDEVLFDDPIEAWANGPVVKSIYLKHRGRFMIDTWEDGDPSSLAENEAATLEIILDGYGHLTGRQLSHLTHSEEPWQDARAGLGPTDRSSAPVSVEVMQAYYSALDADETAQSVDAIDWDALGSS